MSEAGKRALRAQRQRTELEELISKQRPSLKTKLSWWWRHRKHHMVWGEYYTHRNGVRLHIQTCSCGDRKIRPA